MDYLQAIILSIVEGVSEFLPISSTGHLILTANILEVPSTDFLKSFEVIIQLGAILAVCLVFAKRLLENIAIWKKVIVAFLPTAVVGLVFYGFIKNVLLGNPYIVIISLFIGGVILIILEMVYKEKPHHIDRIEDLSLKQSFLIGVVQSVSIIPGVSRAAATIIGGLFLGAKRKVAVEFSFFLAIPTMFAATSLDLVKSNFNFDSYQYSLLLVGLIGSFVTALLVIKWFLKYIQTNNFIIFGVYRIVIAVIFYFLIIK